MLAISAVTGEGIPELIRRVARELERLEPAASDELESQPRVAVSSEVEPPGVPVSREGGDE